METEVPKYGIKLKLNHKYKKRWLPLSKFKINHIWSLLRVILRYILYYIHRWIQGRYVPVNYIKPQAAQQIYGCPLGGLGAGTIGRGYRGEFCRYQLKPGIYEYNTVDANQFIITIKDSLQKTIFQSVLSTYKKQTTKLSKWEWLLDGSECTYTALYPRSWTEYDLSEHGIKLTCRQISPVIPHNYKDSSLPCSVFVWDVENVSSHPKFVTLTFTFKNGTGNSKEDTEHSAWTRSITHGDLEGIEIHHRIKSMLCTYLIGAKKSDWIKISKCLYFDPNSDGAEPWKQLYENGKFKSRPEGQAVADKTEIGCGIACNIRLSAIKYKTLEMSLVWDMPVVNFISSNKMYKRYYTKYFGIESSPVPIADYAMENYKLWEQKIHNWQKPVLDDENLPDWYKSAIFNELYYITDGGTVWFITDFKPGDKNYHPEDPRQEYGRIAFLAGHQSRFYNSIDALFHSSFALLMNWPHLQESLQYDMADFILKDVPVERYTLFGSVKHIRKLANVAPHDVGDPCEEPFILLNSYMNHDVNKWRDLNLKFVLQVFRDYKIMEKYGGNSGVKYLKYMFQACKVVMERSLEYDRDEDGLIENCGLPDQSYSTWTMKGPSSYCNSLWLAALYSMVIMCDELKNREMRDEYYEILKKSKSSFEDKLWNGVYYKFDTSENSDMIMADQLCGHWYLRCSEEEYEVFPKSKVKSALKHIYDKNIKKFGNYKFGAVNGWSNQKTGISYVKSEEVRIDVTYSLASLMIHEGHRDSGWKTAGGMWQLLNDKLGFTFQTPESFHSEGYYWSIGSSSSLCIWSIQLAYEQRKQKQD